MVETGVCVVRYEHATGSDMAEKEALLDENDGLWLRLVSVL